MADASFRFYAELNDFLPPQRRQTRFQHSFQGSPGIRDTVQALGIPHTEIELVLVNGESVDFSYRLRPGDQVSIFPAFESLDITPLLRVRPTPLRIRDKTIRFVLDGHLRRLATYLRLLGFDVLYAPERDYPDGQADARLAETSSDENRILLTRDLGLLKRSRVTRGYWVRATDPKEQIREVVRRFDLPGQAAPFTRCLRCNTPLKPVPETSLPEIQKRLPPRIRSDFREFWECPTCLGIFWKGSHYDHMQNLIRELLIRPR